MYITFYFYNDFLFCTCVYVLNQSLKMIMIKVFVGKMGGISLTFTLLIRGWGGWVGVEERRLCCQTCFSFLFLVMVFYKTILKKREKKKVGGGGYIYIYKKKCLKSWLILECNARDFEAKKTSK